MNNANYNDQYVSLYEYLDSASDIDKRKVLYFASKRIKEIHMNNCYIPYLNAKNIKINKERINDISFIDINNGYNNPDYEKYKELNIYEFAMLSFNSYLPGYNISKNGLLNYGVIRDNFDNFSYIFDKDDVNYFRDVIVNNSFSYYSDYIDNLNNSKGSGKGDSRVLSYYTKEGKLLTENEDAFTNYLLLSIYVVAVLLIIFVIFIYIR